MAKSKDFDSMLPSIAKAMAKEIDDKSGENKWKDAIYYNAQSPDGSAMLKVRVHLNNDSIDASIGPPDDVVDKVYETWEKMFKKSKKGIWYGFKLTVYPDGKHEIEYNYDPNCIDDPSFVDF